MPSFWYCCSSSLCPIVFAAGVVATAVAGVAVAAVVTLMVLGVSKT